MTSWDDIRCPQPEKHKVTDKSELHERGLLAAQRAYDNKLFDMTSPTPTEEPGEGPIGAAIHAYLAIAPQAPVPAFKIGDRVRKKSGSWWEGKIVGFYSTEQTPVGYCVQLDMVANGPVQIYPESALCTAGPAQADDGKDAEIERLRERLQIDPGGGDAIDAAESAAGFLRDRAEKAEAVIRDLVAALDRIAKGAMYIEDFTASTSAVIWAKFAIAKAKSKGYEP